MWYLIIDRGRAKSSASTSALLSVERNWRELVSSFRRSSQVSRMDRSWGLGREDCMHIIRVVGRSRRTE